MLEIVFELKYVEKRELEYKVLREGLERLRISLVGFIIKLPLG